MGSFGTPKQRVQGLEIRSPLPLPGIFDHPKSAIGKPPEPSALRVEIPVFGAVGVSDTLRLKDAFPSEVTSISKALGVTDNLRHPWNRLKGPMEIQPEQAAAPHAAAIRAAIQERVGAVVAQRNHRLRTEPLQSG